MTLKKYLFLMTFATILCFGAWALVLFFVNPESAGMVGFSFFYGSMFLGLLGVFSMVGFLIRYLWKRYEFAYDQVKTSFRQGLMFALLLTGALFLQSYRLLVWWNLLLLVALLAGIEYFFVTKRSSSITKT